MSFKEKFASIQLQKKQLLVLAALIVLFLAFRLFTSLGSEPELKKEPPLVRTVAIGSVASSEETSYPGEVRGRLIGGRALLVALRRCIARLFGHYRQGEQAKQHKGNVAQGHHLAS